MRWFVIFCLLFRLPAPETAARAVDIEFSVVVERWVTETDIWHRERPLPRVFEMLGSERILVRNLASRLIRLGGTRYLPTLVRATYNRDAEIRERAKGLMSYWYVCPECRGSGVCRRKRDDHADCPCDQYHHCVTCKGGGDLRFEAWWTRDEWDSRTGITHRFTEYRRRKFHWPVKPTPTAVARKE